MSNSSDEQVAYPEVFTLHWEGPSQTVCETDASFPQSRDELRERAAREAASANSEARNRDAGRQLWERICAEAARKGDPALWEKRLAAFDWVKLRARGNANDYARRFGVNHATVRTWIADVAKLAYQVGYRLHEDRLLLVGEAPAELARLRELVNRDAASAAAWRELHAVAPAFRGVDGYFHLNEGHVLRARGNLAGSDATLREGLTLAEARTLRALLWNARGQTYWDRGPDSTQPLPDYLDRAEWAFRRAAILDAGLYFPFVNLTQLALEAGDTRRAEYWISELATARKTMDDDMKQDLAIYLREAAWAGALEDAPFWKKGPARWVREISGRAALLLAALLVAGAAIAFAPDAAASDGATRPVVFEPGAPANGGAGGN